MSIDIITQCRNNDHAFSVAQVFQQFADTNLIFAVGAELQRKSIFSVFSHRLSHRPLCRTMGKLHSAKHFVTKRIGIGGLHKIRLCNQRRCLQKRPEKQTSAADENRRIGTQIDLQLAQLIENVLGMKLSCAADRLLNTIR